MQYTLNHDDDLTDNLDVEEPHVWWRVEEYTTTYDHGLHTYIQVRRYVKERETPCGQWIVHEPAYKESRLRMAVGDTYRSWVHNDGSRKFSKTKREALSSFWYRKQSHVDHAEGRLEKAMNAFKAISEVLGKDPETKAQRKERTAFFSMERQYDF